MRVTLVELVVIVFVLTLLALISAERWPGLPAEVATGWWRHATVELPKRAPAWPRVAAYGVAVVALGIGAHLFLGWLWRGWRGWRGSTWRVRWTVLGLALVLVMFVAGTAAVAVVHQTAWLARSPEPMYSRLHGPHACPSHLRILGQCMLLFDNDYRRLPDDLAELIEAQDVEPFMLVCFATDDAPATGRTPQERAAGARQPGHCSYVYLGKGRRVKDVPADDVLAYEPIENHRDGSNVLFGDGSVTWVGEGELRQMLARQEARAASRPTTRGVK